MIYSHFKVQIVLYALCVHTLPMISIRTKKKEYIKEKQCMHPDRITKIKHAKMQMINNELHGIIGI